jgi:hypothetical protein
MRCSCWLFYGRTPRVGDAALIELETPQKVAVYRCLCCGEIRSEEMTIDESAEIAVHDLQCTLEKRIVPSAFSGKRGGNMAAA